MTMTKVAEQADERSLLRASEVGVERLGYKNDQAVRTAIQKGMFPLPVYKRENAGASPWLVRSDEVEDYFDSLVPVKVA